MGRIERSLSFEGGRQMVTTRCSGQPREFRKSHIFHLSGKRFGIEDDEWKGMPKNQLVFIGQNLEREKLKGLLEGCVA